MRGNCLLQVIESKLGSLFQSLPRFTILLSNRCQHLQDSHNIMKLRSKCHVCCRSKTNYFQRNFVLQIFKNVILFPYSNHFSNAKLFHLSYSAFAPDLKQNIPVSFKNSIVKFLQNKISVIIDLPAEMASFVDK